MNNFNGVSSKTHHYKDIEDKNFYLVLEINLDNFPGGQMFNAPFIMGIRVNEEANFNIMYSVSYSFRDDMRNFIKKVKDSDARKFNEEELTEPERFEKEWIFQLINQRQTNYIESFNRS